MNLFDLISKDLETLRKEHADAMAYAESMTAAQIEYTDKICVIADRHGVERKQAVTAAINAIIEQLVDGAFEKEATK